MNSICNRFFSLIESLASSLQWHFLCVHLFLILYRNLFIHPIKQRLLKLLKWTIQRLFFLNDGLNAGLDVGMTATVRRGDSEVASVLIVASEPSKSAAMILELTNEQSIEVGDNVKIKTTRLS